MLINAHTKISQLLKENSQSLDAICSLARPLEKLRNPILRKLMASRTSIQQAADIGGCTVEEFLLILRPLGFEINNEDTNEGKVHPDTNTSTTKPEWLLNLSPEKITPFDVRDMLNSGHDPLKEIMAEYKKLQPGTVLQLINSFFPTPLLRLLEKKGALTYSEKMEERLIHSYFFKPEKTIEKTATKNKEKPDGDLISTMSELDFKLRLAQFSSLQTTEIDVRGLQMPEPMQTILRELEQLPKAHALFVHHKRIPVYLLEDLQASGKYQVFIWPVSETQVDLLLTHNS